MPTYRVAANSYAIQMVGGYSTGPARNAAGFVGTEGWRGPPAKAIRKERAQVQAATGPLSTLTPELILPPSEIDTPVVVELLEEFQAQTMGQVLVPVDPERITRRYSRWPHVQAIHAATGVYCELTVQEGLQECEFTGAFPRGASKALIGPVFAECARHAIAELGSRQPGVNVSGWRVWGEFLHGQDAVQVPDGGQSICQSWVAYFATVGLPVTARLKTPGSNVWIAEMTLGDLATHYPGVGGGSGAGLLTTLYRRTRSFMRGRMRRGP